MPGLRPSSSHPPMCIHRAELRRNTRRTVNAGQPRVPAVQRQQGRPHNRRPSAGQQDCMDTPPLLSVPVHGKAPPFPLTPGPGMPMMAIVAGGVRSGTRLSTWTAALEAEVAAACPRRTPPAARGIFVGITTGDGGRVVSRLSRTPRSSPVQLPQQSTS